MNSKNLQVLAAATVGVAALIFMIRDPVGSANAVRNGWDMLVGGLGSIGNALYMFIQTLFAAKYSTLLGIPPSAHPVSPPFRRRTRTRGGLIPIRGLPIFDVRYPPRVYRKSRRWENRYVRIRTGQGQLRQTAAPH